MRIVLSRKGLDSSFGNLPSPVLPDNELCWLPIPSNSAKDVKYGDLYSGRLNIDTLLGDLTADNSNLVRLSCHLDPDLSRNTVKRNRPWKASFGQCSVAQSHLDANRVSIGDLFLFFGWFRNTLIKDGQLFWDDKNTDKHILFGWLQVGEKYSLSSDYKHAPAYIHYHPHYVNHSLYTGAQNNNTIYVAAKSLTFHGNSYDLPGAGMFKKMSNDLCLTTQHAKSRSYWRLPLWFFPENGKRPLSYHGELNRWSKNSNYTLLRSVGRGQEFILDSDEYPEALDWAYSLISNNTHC